MFCRLWFVDGILQCILLCFLMAHFPYFSCIIFWDLFVPLDEERDCESELSCQQSCMVGSCIAHNAFLNISSDISCSFVSFLHILFVCWLFLNFYLLIDLLVSLCKIIGFILNPVDIQIHLNQTGDFTKESHPGFLSILLH